MKHRQSLNALLRREAETVVITLAGIAAAGGIAILALRAWA
ncbi:MULTISPECIES: hypothetical protein [unclassified Variovorax]|nr:MULTISPECIES: hypothetical protein [unclassified Variovorax]MDM0090287.1 hypothetical protein [Variovorax sp. J22G40]MDM0148047.1 hypothetical protein [Variovorax sp. J2P1-31]